MRALRGAAFAAAVAIILTGCSSRTCPTCPLPTSGVAPPDKCGDDIGEISRKIANAVANSKGPPEILMLSGGGSYGAWGAGFLNGWSGRSDPPSRPDFEVVTGSSTGAILGTWAFIGPSADANAKAAYTETDDDDVYIRTFPWIWLQPWRWGSIKPWVSIKNLAPLRDLFEKWTPMEQVEQVGAISRHEHRVFLVGTVDIDLGAFCVWDMGALAEGMIDAPLEKKKAIYRRYREIIMASSSNPIIFNPTYIDGSMHVDGGVRHQIFLFNLIAPAIAEGIKMRRHPVAGHSAPASPQRTALDPEPLSSDCHAGGKDGRPQLYAIVNGPLVIRRRCTPENMYNIGQRSLTVMEMQAMLGSLYQAKSECDDKLGDGLRWNLCVSHVPNDADVWSFADEFPKDRMRKLYALADERAKSPDAWIPDIPKLGPSPLPCEERKPSVRSERAIRKKTHVSPEDRR